MKKCHHTVAILSYNALVICYIVIIFYMALYLKS